MKITAIGPKTWNDRAGKNFRTISIDGKEMSAWDRTADAVDRFKVGDDVEVSVVEKNGRSYLNKITAAGASASGAGMSRGGPGSSGGSFAPKDNGERDLAVYTRYALDAYLQSAGKLDVKASVDLVFDVRKAVKGRLAGEKEAADDTLEIKVKTINDLLAKAGVKATGEGTPWPSYIIKRLRMKDGFKFLTEDVQGLIDGVKELSALADGTPVFIAQ